MLLKYLLLVSKNAISCCMFIFYPTWLLNLFTNCRTFEWMNLILNQSACLYIIHFFFLAYFRRETKILIPTLLGWELILKRSIHVTGANSGSARSSPSRRYSTISVIFWTFLGGMIDDLYQMLFFLTLDDMIMCFFITMSTWWIILTDFQRLNFPGMHEITDIWSWRKINLEFSWILLIKSQ